MQRACNRARPFSARQSILLITEMIFDYLIVIISLKAAEMGMSEVAKKFDIFALPQCQITQRAYDSLIFHVSR